MRSSVAPTSGGVMRVASGSCDRRLSRLLTASVVASACFLMVAAGAGAAGLAVASPPAGPVFVIALACTNATAFSPTDVMPLSCSAKMLMLLQLPVALLTVALVIARAVNILKG